MLVVKFYGEKANPRKIVLFKWERKVETTALIADQGPTPPSKRKVLVLCMADQGWSLAWQGSIAYPISITYENPGILRYPQCGR